MTERHNRRDSSPFDGSFSMTLLVCGWPIAGTGFSSINVFNRSLQSATDAHGGFGDSMFKADEAGIHSKTTPLTFIAAGE